MMCVWRTDPRRMTHEPVPEPRDGELLLRVRACGVCRTDLHVAARDLPVHRPHVVPGHEVVGEVVAGTADVPAGALVGVAWLRGTCGTCRYCTSGAENLCPASTYTGWDADGGYADYATVPTEYAYRLPAGYSDIELAPLLWASSGTARCAARTCRPVGGWASTASARAPT